jgi:hypothetical protein
MNARLRTIPRTILRAFVAESSDVVLSFRKYAKASPNVANVRETTSGDASRLHATSACRTAIQGYAAYLSAPGTSASLFSAAGPRPWAVFSQNDGVSTSCQIAFTAATDIITQ